MIKVGISTQQGLTADMVVVAFDGNTGVHHPAFNNDYNDDYNHE
jgi:hypothetical protein